MSGSTEPLNSDTLPDVCVVTHPLGAAGENATRSLLDILASITGTVLITANLPNNSEIHNTREVIELTESSAGESIPTAAVRFLLNQLRMCRAIFRRPEPIVLFFGATSYFIPILFARLLGKRVVIQPRGNVPLTLRLSWEQRVHHVLARILAGFIWWLERLDFCIAHAIITYTPTMAKELGLDVDSEKVFPDGGRYVRTERFEIKTPYSSRENVVGFVGRIDEEKGIRALAATAKQLPADITFRFVGDGDLRGWLEAELQPEIEAGQIELIGWVNHDEIPLHLNEMRLLVLPSQPTEGLPTTILESMACGTPVYARSVSGVPDVVREGDTGFLIDSKDPASLAAGIEEILERDDLATISSNGRQLITSEYTHDAAIKRYRKILQQVS